MEPFPLVIPSPLRLALPGCCSCFLAPPLLTFLFSLNNLPFFRGCRLSLFRPLENGGKSLPRGFRKSHRNTIIFFRVIPAGPQLEGWDLVRETKCCAKQYRKIKGSQWTKKSGAALTGHQSGGTIETPEIIHAFLNLLFKKST